MIGKIFSIALIFLSIFTSQESAAFSLATSEPVYLQSESSFNSTSNREKRSAFRASLVNSVNSIFTSLSTPIKQFVEQTSSRISTLLRTASSLWVRLLLAFFLGILMSLTPCIYPMIPITVGILQARSNRSWLHHGLHALTYATGLATTFAVLGLLVSTGTAYHGALFNSPYFVIIMVFFLAYMAFSLFDFYPMYTPRLWFASTTESGPKNNSFTSTFLLGTATGTMASPCLSPGLALLLVLVAQLANKAQGFLLLFLFGIGSSFPLLIASFFSHTFLPRAGSWMVEIKKLFGLLLLATCLYYLTFILPWNAVLIISSIGSAALALYYRTTIQSDQTKAIKRFKLIMSMGLMGLAILTGSQACNPATQQSPLVLNNWHSSYTEASGLALEQGKPLLFDFTASWCTLCKAVEKDVLSHLDVPEIICLTIDCTDYNAVAQQLLKELNVQGFPTLVLYDPQHKKVIKRWTSEIAHVTPGQFTEELKTALQNSIERL